MPLATFLTGLAAALAGWAAWGLGPGFFFAFFLRRISPLAVEIWSVVISMPNFSLMKGCICMGLASRPSSARARRTASFLLIPFVFLAMVADSGAVCRRCYIHCTRRPWLGNPME